MGYEVVNTNFTEYRLDDNSENIALMYLVKSLERMAHCEAVLFHRDWSKYRGCKTEHTVAEKYGLKIFYQDEAYRQVKRKYDRQVVRHDNGIHYKNLRQLAQDLNMNYNTLNSRRGILWSYEREYLSDV
jgi:hypothetical protein